MGIREIIEAKEEEDMKESDDDTETALAALEVEDVTKQDVMAMFDELRDKYPGTLIEWINDNIAVIKLNAEESKAEWN